MSLERPAASAESGGGLMSRHQRLHNHHVAQEATIQLRPYNSEEGEIDEDEEVG